MTQNPITEELKILAIRLHGLFPECPHIQIVASPAGIDVSLHDAGDYDAVTALMRRLGAGDRQKAIFDENSDRPWSVQRGQVDGVRFVGFCSTIPPSCHIEEVEETVPEVAATGRTITQKRRVVKCGGAAA